MNHNEYTGFLLIPQIIPTTARENLTKSGKRRPMTPAIASKLYSKPTCPVQFQRIAGTFYGTSALNKTLVYLKNEITGKHIRIDFKNQKGFMVMQSTSYKGGSSYTVEIQTPYPLTNRDLFIRLTSRNYI